MARDGYVISGSGGGSGGSSGDFTQTPDNIRSEDTFEGLLGLGHGKWLGPVNGMQSIRINDTPLVDASGVSNFKEWTARFADGDPTLWPQKPSLVLGTGASPVSINTTLANPAGTGTPVVRTVSNTGADFIDLRFVVSELYHQTDAGIFSATMHVRVRMKPTGHTGWIEILADTTATEPTGTYDPNGYYLAQGILSLFGKDFYSGSTRDTTGIVNGQLTITGKTTQPAVKEIRIAVPNTGNYASTGWDIECTLMDVESYSADPVFDKRTVLWESASAVYKSTTLGTQDSWHGLAWLSMLGQASDQISGVPEVWGEYKTKIVSVPPATIFNPTTRQYTGSVWNGSWIKAYTNDPAWAINDALQDTIAGVSAMAPGSYLNKWDALELSKYCSALVPDGNGGTHCRFSMNAVFNQPQKADDFIRNMAGAVGALAWDNGGGEWRCKIDKQENPVAIFTEENIEGEFTYTHTDVDARYNDVTVTYLNSEFDYREDRVRIWDPSNIALYGRKTTSVVGIGCTNRQEALRRCVLRLRTSMNEYRMVSFVTNRQGRFLEPLSTILVADKSLGYTAPSGSTALANTDARDDTTGRIQSMNGGRTTIFLRDPVRLEPGASYTIQLTTPNSAYNPDATTQPGTDWDKPTLVISRTVTTGSPRGDVTQIDLTSALPSDTPANAVFSLVATGLPANPKTYRIIEIEEDDDRERVRIMAIEVDSGKYAAADAITGDGPQYEGPDSTVPMPLAPSTGVLHTKSFASQYATNSLLTIDWWKPDSTWITGYEVWQSFNDSPPVRIASTTGLHHEIQNPQWGSYTFFIYAFDRQGRRSRALTASITINEYTLNSLAGYLTNESHTLPADSAGNITSYSGAGGVFKVFLGNTDVTAGCTFSVITNPQSLTGSITNATGVYVVSGGFDAAEPSATIEYRATHTATGSTISKIFSLAKAPGGLNAKLLYLTSDRQQITYDNTGALSPSTQTTTFSIQSQNLSTGTFTISMTNATGGVINANSYLTAVSGSFTAAGNNITFSGGTQFQMTASAFNSARGVTQGVIVTVTHADGVSDVISIIKTQDGATGTSGVTITVNPPAFQIMCDSAGTVKAGQFNKTAQITVMSGQTNVSSSATYGSATFTGCTGSVNSSGLITITGISASSATVSVPVTYGSASQTIVVTLVKVLDGATGTPGSGGPSGAIEMSATNAADGFLPIAVTNGTLYFDNVLLSISLGAGTAASSTLTLLNEAGSTVVTLGTVSCTSGSPFNSTTINTSVATGISAGVWKQWKIKLHCTATGVGASSDGDASGVFHQ